VRTPFFVQVDADMVLDPDAVRRLRAAMSEEVGIAVGRLEDPLAGRIVGVKLFRTVCFQHTRFPDSISPDTDFGAAIATAGWRTAYLGGAEDDGKEPTLGLHDPAYEPAYTFRKYLLEGRRYRHRRRPDGLRWHLGRLEGSAHPRSALAQVALANGIFLETDRDLLEPGEEDAGFRAVERLLALEEVRGAEPGPRHAEPTIDPADARGTFLRYRALGAQLARAGDGGAVRGLLVSLHGGGRNESPRIAKIGICRGLLDAPGLGDAKADLEVLAGFLADDPGSAFAPRPSSPTGLGGVVAEPIRRVAFQLALTLRRVGEPAYHRVVDGLGRLPLEPGAGSSLGRRSAQANGGHPGGVAYLIRRYPALSETFVRREIEALRAKGLAIAIYAWERDDLPDGSESTDAVYLTPRSWGRRLRRAVRWAVRHPFRSLRLAAFVVSSRYHAHKRPVADAKLFLDAVEVADRARADGIGHLHAPWADLEAFVALVAAHLADATYSLQARAYEIHRRGAIWALPEKLRGARFVITNTEYNEAHLRRLVPGGAPTIHQVYNGVDPDRITAPARRDRDGPGRILSVGRLVPKKGFDVLLEAMAILRDEGLDARCDVIGGEPEGRPLHGLALRRLRLRLDLEERVTFRGARAFGGVLEAYHAADVFALACVVDEDGDRDVIPNVVLEAMALELPVVSTHVGGIPELVEHGRTGLLVEPGDPRAFAEALRRLLADPVLRRSFGRAGRERVLERFDIRRNVETHARLFLGPGGVGIRRESPGPETPA
jgi:glycosyltransferase involved in cell wall biosynthesis